jgi:hypothetical protein
LFSPDGRIMVSVEGKFNVVFGPWGIPVAKTDSPDNCAMIFWDAQTHKEIESLRISCDINGLAMSKGGKRPAAAGKTVTIYERR